MSRSATAAAVAAKGGKKKGATFVIDCSKPVDDNIMEIASLDKFLHERIKVGGKAGALGDSVTVTRDKNKITVTCNSAFSKRLTATYSRPILVFRLVYALQGVLLFGIVQSFTH